MSMEVDLNSPLTERERAYLAERGRYSEIERADAMHGVTGQSLPEGDGTGPAQMQTSLTFVQDQRIAELERQLAELRGQQAPDESMDESDEDSEVDPYESWTVQELDAELKRRNLPVKGDKQAKVTALYDHDDVAGA